MISNPNSLANLDANARGVAGLMSVKQRQRAIKLFDAWYDTADLPQACVAAGVPYATINTWMQQYRWFRRRYLEMRQWFADVAEAEAHRRGVSGWDEPVFYKDRIVGTIRKFDNDLLVKLLRRYKPKEWSEKHQQLDGDGNVTVPGAATVIIVHPQMQDMGDFRALCEESARIQAANKVRVIEHGSDRRTDSTAIQPEG